MLCSTVVTQTNRSHVITFSGRTEEKTNHLNSRQEENDEINYGTSINIKLCSPKKKVEPHAAIRNISKIAH